MNLTKLLGVISPTIYKRDLADQLYNLAKELEESTIPSYAEANQLFQRWDFKTKEVKRLLPTFNAIVRKRSGNIITTTYDVLKNISVMTTKMRDQVNKTFEDKTANSALTYKKAQYLLFLDAVKFYSSYVREFLNYVIIAETGNTDSGNQIKKSLTDAQRSVVESFYTNYCQLTNAFTLEAANVIRLLEDVPDIIIVPDNIPLVEAAHGKRKVDPLGFNFISADKNPFYSFQLSSALADHQKYQKALEERELLRLRLLGLQRNLDGTPDPAVEKEIDVYQDRIQKLDYQIKKEEDKYL